MTRHAGTRIVLWVLAVGLFVVVGCAAPPANRQEATQRTQVKFDPYTQAYAVTGPQLDLGGFPNITKVWMRGGFDKEGRTAFVQLYVLHWSQTGWKFLRSANDVTGTPLNVRQLDREVQRGGNVEEHVAIDLPRAFLEERKVSGLNIRVDGSKGSLIVEVSGVYVAGFLAKFDEAIAAAQKG
jgi:hypothetical protein